MGRVEGDLPPGVLTDAMWMPVVLFRISRHMVPDFEKENKDKILS